MGLTLCYNLLFIISIQKIKHSAHKNTLIMEEETPVYTPKAHSPTHSPLTHTPTPTQLPNIYPAPQPIPQPHTHPTPHPSPYPNPRATQLPNPYPTPQPIPPNQTITIKTHCIYSVSLWTAITSSAQAQTDSRPLGMGKGFAFKHPYMCDLTYTASAPLWLNQSKLQMHLYMIKSPIPNPTRL